MRQEQTLSGRTRAAIAASAPASLSVIQQTVPEVTPQLLYALTRAGHIVRTGARGQFRYSPGRQPQPYGGTAAERKARQRERKDRANEKARAKYAEKRGGKVKPRHVPSPRPIVRPKPTPAQQIVIHPPIAPLYQVHKPKPRPLMTSQEWEAQGGKVERLPPGAVSRPLRSTAVPA